MIKDIMVHLDGSPEDEIRLEHGQALASAGRAHLIGLFTNQLPDLTVAMPMDGGAAAIQILTELQDQALKDGDATAKWLKRAAGRPSGAERVAPARRVVRRIVRQRSWSRPAAPISSSPRGPMARPTHRVWPDLVEAVLFGSGRALLLVPPGRHRQGPIQTVLVAWNGSRESARALREGLDFIEQAARTVVLVVDPPTDRMPWAEVKAHLAHHDVVAEVVTAESQDRRIADVILEEARRISADLIIMGAYGHTRLREQVFGGATRDMLTASESPILVAH